MSSLYMLQQKSKFRTVLRRIPVLGGLLLLHSKRMVYKVHIIVMTGMPDMNYRVQLVFTVGMGTFKYYELF